MTSDIIKSAEKKMQGAIDFAKEDFSGVRTGRANPAMFEKLEAEYYGVPTPIQQLASFSSPDAHHAHHPLRQGGTGSHREGGARLRSGRQSGQ